MELVKAPSSWRIVKLIFLRKPNATPQKGRRSYTATALTSMSKWYAACMILRLGTEKEPESWRQLHVGGVDGMRCQHLQVKMTQLLHTSIVSGRRTEGP